MKTPEEYLKNWNGYGKFLSRELAEIIKLAQTESYNECLDDIFSKSQWQHKITDSFSNTRLVVLVDDIIKLIKK